MSVAVPRQPDPRGTRQCRRCHVRLSLDAFDVLPDGKPRRVCRGCDAVVTAVPPLGAMAPMRMGTHGTAALCTRLRKIQGHVCAVCRHPETASDTDGGPLPLALFSCAQQGRAERVRGLICLRCDIMLKMAGNDPARLALAIAFLSTPQRVIAEEHVRDGET